MHSAVARRSRRALGRLKPAPAPEEMPFAAILVMCDPYQWYEAVQARGARSTATRVHVAYRRLVLQVACDVLCSHSPLTLHYDAAASPPMPIHFSNPDFLSKFEHPYPRFAQARRGTRQRGTWHAGEIGGTRQRCLLSLMAMI